MDNKRMVYQVFANQPQGSRPRGRPKFRWSDCVYGDITQCKIRNWEQRSKNREEWMRSVKEPKAHFGLKSQLIIIRRRIREVIQLVCHAHKQAAHGPQKEDYLELICLLLNSVNIFSTV
jgi:hypothetical protein